MKIVKAKMIGKFNMELVFDDGTIGKHDFSGLVGHGVFTLWNDPSKFADFSIGSCGELKWGDEVDICPDSLYLDITGKKPGDIFPSLKREFCHA
jgi:hypothetical protein